MSKDLRTIVNMFLIAVIFSFGNFAAVSSLDAAQEEDSTEAIQIEEADVDVEVVVEPEVDSELSPVVEDPVKVEVTTVPEEDESAAAITSTERTGAIEILTKESFTQWINPLILLFLVICFLGWLLAMFLRKPDNVASSAGESADDKTTGSGHTASRLTAANSTASNTTTTASSGLGIGRVFAEKPATVDDLTKIGGIEAHDAKRLNEAGIWQYEQLRNMTAQQRANLQRRLNLPHIRWYSLTGLSDVSTASLATESKNSLTAGGENATTRIDSAGPKGSAADLKLHSGAEAKGGVKSSEAITSTTGQGGSGSKSTPGSASSTSPGKSGVGEAAAIRVDSAAAKNESVGSPKFGSKSGIKVTAAAAAAAVGLGAASLKSGQGSETSTSSGTADGKSTSSGGGSANGDNARSGGNSSATKAAMSAAGSTLAAQGETKRDDLTQLAGIDSAAAAKLNAAGIYSFDQLKGLGDQQASSLAKKCGIPNANFSDSRRSNFAGSGETTSGHDSSSASGTAGSSPAAQGESKRDDLTRLAGIDAAAAARLNAAGIYSFDQLKGLDDQQALQLAEKCQIPNADVSDWRRCIYAWGRGIETTSETDETFAAGSMHGIELPQVADGVFDGEKLVAYPEQVIFRGSNPEGWGRGGRESIDGVEASLSSDTIRSDINFLRIRRTDTRESVVVPMTKGQLFANGDPNENGWNGSSEVFFGGRHIGVFAQHLPQEVETKFSQGGWGFGHRYDHNDRQEWGWAGRVIEPTSFEVSVGCIGDTPGTVVFRGSDPSIWNTKTRDGGNRFSDPIDTVKHPVKFVRIMRQATGEAVIVRVDGNHVLDEGFDPRCGWNGSCSEFSGGQHLGVYHCDLVQDFETRFEFGGWGFGHPYNDNDRQAWGWAGRQLPETVFEISLLEDVPDFMQHELVE